MEVRQIVIRLGSDQTERAFYTHDGETLTMTYFNGEPVELDGEPVTEKIGPEQVVAVAGILAKRIRKSFRGELVEGFSRRLEYPAAGIA